MGCSAVSPNLVVAQLDEAIDAFPGGILVGVAGRGGGLDRGGRAFGEIDGRDAAAPLAVVGAEPEPASGVEQGGGHFVVDGECLLGGEVVHRGPGRPAHDDKAGGGDLQWPEASRSTAGELGALADRRAECRRVDAADPPVGEAGEDRFAFASTKAFDFDGFGVLLNEADIRQLKSAI